MVVAAPAAAAVCRYCADGRRARAASAQDREAVAGEAGRQLAERAVSLPWALRPICAECHRSFLVPPPPTPPPPRPPPLFFFPRVALGLCCSTSILFFIRAVFGGL